MKSNLLEIIIIIIIIIIINFDQFYIIHFVSVVSSKLGSSKKLAVMLTL